MLAFRLGDVAAALGHEVATLQHERGLERLSRERSLRPGMESPHHRLASMRHGLDDCVPDAYPVVHRPAIAVDPGLYPSFPLVRDCDVVEADEAVLQCMGERECGHVGHVRAARAGLDHATHERRAVESLADEHGEMPFGLGAGREGVSHVIRFDGRDPLPVVAQHQAEGVVAVLELDGDMPCSDAEPHAPAKESAAVVRVWREHLSRARRPPWPRRSAARRSRARRAAPVPCAGLRSARWQVPATARPGTAPGSPACRPRAARAA